MGNPYYDGECAGRGSLATPVQGTLVCVQRDIHKQVEERTAYKSKKLEVT